MPKVLELKPLKKKNLKLVMVESEFPIDWRFETPKKVKDDYLRGLNLISGEYVEVIEGLIEKFKPDFGVVEKPVDWNTSPNKADPFVHVVPLYLQNCKNRAILHLHPLSYI